MDNLMTTKRDLLKAFLLDVVQHYDQGYTLEDRLRMATFQQTSRAERIEIMGENYAYGEVLHRPSQTPDGQRSAKSTTRNKPHTFDVFLWHKLDDGDSYEQSSQKLWDDLTYEKDDSEEDYGVIPSIENKSYFEDSGNQYIVLKPVNIQSHEVVMDNNPLELAHFMNFQVTIKG